MKFCALVFAFILFSVPAMAFTPVTKEKANTYYQSCVSQAPTQQFLGNGQEMMCACQAARMTQFFSMEDMNAMMSQDPAIARPAYNKMMVDVYAPCMEEPTRAYHYNACISNPQTARLGNPQKLCTCMSDFVGKHMATNGSLMFSEILAKDPNNMDPMTTVFEDPKFRSYTQSKLIACVR